MAAFILNIHQATQQTPAALLGPAGRDPRAEGSGPGTLGQGQIPGLSQRFPGSSPTQAASPHPGLWSPGGCRTTEGLGYRVEEDGDKLLTR
jgi:hypothetical protein